MGDDLTVSPRIDDSVGLRTQQQRPETLDTAAQKAAQEASLAPVLVPQSLRDAVIPGIFPDAKLSSDSTPLVTSPNANDRERSKTVWSMFNGTRGLTSSGESSSQAGLAKSSSEKVGASRGGIGVQLAAGFGGLMTKGLLDANKAIEDKDLGSLATTVTSLHKEGVLGNVIKLASGERLNDAQSKALAGLTARVMSNLPPDPLMQAKIVHVSSKLIEDINKEGLNIKKDLPNILSLTQDAFLHLKPEERKALMDDVIKTGLTLADGTMSDAKKDAFAKILTNLPDNKSVAKLLDGLSKIDSKDPNSKEAQTLALISNHLAEARAGDLTPGTKNLHRNLVANLIKTGGVDYKTANLAARILDNIDPNKKEGAIKLALSLKNEKDPLKAFSTSADSAAKTDIAKAGVKILKEAGMDTDRVARTLASLVDKNGNLDNNKMAGVVAALVRAGAPAVVQKTVSERLNAGLSEAFSNPLVLIGSFVTLGAVGAAVEGHAHGLAADGLRRASQDIANWEPGRTNGSETHKAMNERYYSATNQLQSELGSKSSDISNLYNLFKASGTPLGQSNMGTSQADLEYLKGLGQATQALANDSNPFRIRQEATVFNDNGKFKVFTDNNQQFYQLTKGDTERYAMKVKGASGQDEWQFLQGNNFSYQNKSYADTINSFKQNEAQQPKIISRLDKQEDPSFKYYETPSGKSVAFYQGKDPKYQNLVYEGTGGKYRKLSPEETTVYQKAVIDWGAKIQPNTEPILSEDGKYKVYRRNDGGRVAEGNIAATKGVVFTQTSADESNGKWARYQAQAQQYQTQRPAYQQQAQQYQTQRPAHQAQAQQYRPVQQNLDRQKLEYQARTGKFR